MVYEKLNPKYYRLYKLIDKVRDIVYKLDLCEGASMYSTFHVSKLKVMWSHAINTINLSYKDKLPHLEPQSIFDHKLVKRGPIGETMILVQWKGKPLNEAMWEYHKNLSLGSPHLPLW